MSEEDGPEIWIVDRVQGPITVLIDEVSGVVVEVSTALLGERATEGAVLVVPVGKVGEPIWEEAVRDEGAEALLRGDAEASIDRLRLRDPGGDIEL